MRLARDQVQLLLIDADVVDFHARGEGGGRGVAAGLAADGDVEDDGVGVVVGGAIRPSGHRGCLPAEGMSL
jgi:hypothetical protein